jgi:hypothetical protein
MSTALQAVFGQVDDLVRKKILEFLVGDLRYIIISPQAPLPPSALSVDGINELVDMNMSMQEVDTTIIFLVISQKHWSTRG